jgi:HK97 family phage prohead protease
MDEKIVKSTVEKLELWQPIVKSSNGNYVAILSDDSIDRDDEIIGKTALIQAANSTGYTAALINHDNNVMGLVGEWTNKRVEKIGDHYALIAEPKFYMSNPKAIQIKESLDAGASIGVSIGAIPKAHEMVTINNKKFKSYTDLELLEASFVAIPANKHAMAMAVAKMYHEVEEKKMTEDNEISKKLEEQSVSYELKIKEMEDKSQVIVKELEDKKLELEKAVTENNSKVGELQKQLEEAKNKTLAKGIFETDTRTVEKSVADNIKEGKMPVFRH